MRVQRQKLENKTRVYRNSKTDILSCQDLLNEPQITERNLRSTISNPVSRLAVISCYYNPGMCDWQRANCAKFIRTIGQPLYLAELSYGGKFEMPSQLQIHGDLKTQLMWQKERLLSLVERVLPEKYDAVAWIDADVIFEDPDWAEKTLDVLNKNHVCQLFSDCVESHPSQGIIPIRQSESVCHAYLRGEKDFNNLSIFHPGFAWAIRRDTLHKIGSFDYSNIVGSGDTQMVRGFFNVDMWCDKFYSPGWRKFTDAWRTNANNVINSQIGCVSGTIQHLWHGDRIHRKYIERLTYLGLNGYDPYTDLVVEPGKILSWSESGLAKIDMVEQIKGYFNERRSFSIHERLGDAAHEDLAAALGAFERQTHYRS